MTTKPTDTPALVDELEQAIALNNRGIAECTAEFAKAKFRKANEAIERAINALREAPPTPAPSAEAVRTTQEPCSLGVGCDEAGVCYAAAHDQPEQCPKHGFEREERYIVVKRKRLHPDAERIILDTIEDFGCETPECVIVESDWPEYETVWQMIEARVTGRTLPTTPSPTSPDFTLSDEAKAQIEEIENSQRRAMASADKIALGASPTSPASVEALEQIALDMEHAVAGGMSWISHGEAVEFVRRIRKVGQQARRCGCGQVLGPHDDECSLCATGGFRDDER